MSLLYILDNDCSEYVVRFDLSDSELNFSLPFPEKWFWCQLDSAHNPFNHHFRDSF